MKNTFRILLCLLIFSSINCVKNNKLSGVLPSVPGTPGDNGFVNGQVLTNFKTDAHDMSGDSAKGAALQSDGKVVVAFSVDGLSEIGVLRYNTDGSLDTSFNSTGFAHTGITGSVGSAAEAMVLQSDGKIVVAGVSTLGGIALVRYNTDGTLDTSFSADGTLDAMYDPIGNGDTRAMALQSDGKILVAGMVSLGGPYDFAIARFNTDGSIDTTFNGTGVVITDFAGNNDIIRAITVQTDGKIVVGGSSGSDFALARYNSNGSLDATFGTGGTVVLDVGIASDERIFTLAIQPDGKILAAGNSNSAGTYDFAIARFDADGTFDATFNGGSTVLYDFPTADQDDVWSIVLLAGGKIMLGGSVYDNLGNGDFGLLRLNANGSVDAAFNGTGSLTTTINAPSDDSLDTLLMQTDGSFVAVGTSIRQNYSYDVAIVRYSGAGVVDAAYGTAGKVSFDTPMNSDENLHALDVAPDGKIIAGGRIIDGPGREFAVARYTSDGKLDITFGTGGLVITDIGSNSMDELYQVKVQADGKVLAFGSTDVSGVDDDMVLVRYNVDGSLDATFGTGGIRIIDFGGTEAGHGLAIQADGKILVGGRTTVSAGNGDFIIARLNTDGTFDATYGTAGSILVDVGPASGDELLGMTLQSDGKAVAVGYTFTGGIGHFSVVRLNTNGTLDATFNTTGKVFTDLGRDSMARDVDIQPDGKIVVVGLEGVGGFPNYGVVRYNADGSLDTSFNGTGMNLFDFNTGSWDAATRVRVLPDGKIAVVGMTSGGPDPAGDFGLIRLLSDGTADASFGTGGLMYRDMGITESNEAYAMALQADGTILVGGSAATTSGSSDFGIWRVE